jgi:hypothetical protein
MVTSFASATPFVLLQILQREAHCAVEAVQPAAEYTAQAGNTAASHHAAGIWPRTQAAGCSNQQSIALIPAFGAFHAVVAAAADVAATDAAVAQLLHLIHQQAANTDNVTAQQHQQTQFKQLQLSSQQLAGVAVPPEQVLQLLYASCKLQQTPSQLLQLLTHSAIQALPQLAPMQVADVLSSLAACHDSCKPPAKQLPKRAVLNKAVSKYLQQNQHAFDASSTVALVTALARDSFTGGSTSSDASSNSSSSSSSFTLLSMLMMDHMQQMSSQQLAAVLGACAAAEHYNQAVVDAAAQMAVQLLRQQGFKLRQQQHQQDADAPGQAQQQVLADAHSFPRQQQHTAAASPSAVTSSRLAADRSTSQQQQQQHQDDCFSPESLAQLLQACSTLRHHSAGLLECAATATLRSLGTMQLQQVVAVVAACAQLNHYNLALFQEACRLAEQAMSDDPSQQQQQQLANTGSSRSSEGSVAGVITQLAWSCAVVHHLEPAFFRTLAAWAGRLQLKQLNEQQLLQWFQVRFSCRCCHRQCSILVMRYIGSMGATLPGCSSKLVGQCGT